MSSFYDKFGNSAYVSVSSSDITNSDGSVGGIFSGVPLSFGDTEQKKQVPNFKALFEDYQMHNPDEHRSYLFVPFEHANQSNSPHNSYKLGRYYSHYEQYIESYDKEKLELQSLKKNNGESFLTLSTDFVNYLKSQDRAYALTMTELQYYQNHFNAIYNALPYYQKYEVDGGSLSRIHNNYNASVNEKKQQINDDFGGYVASVSRSLIELDKPFYYESVNDDNESTFLPVSLGNFSAYEIDEVINDIYGNVTDDDFISSVNEEKYNQKAETECCLKLCLAPELYRAKGVSYDESEQKVLDDIEFDKYKNSDEFSPYVPPPPYKSITLNQYKNYLNEAQSFLNSPMVYLMNKIKPYIEKGLINLQNGGYIDSYKLNRNGVEIYKEIDF